MSNLILNNGNIKKLAYFALLLSCQLVIFKIVIYADTRVFTDGPGIGMGTVIYNEHIGNPTEATTDLGIPGKNMEQKYHPSRSFRHPSGMKAYQ